VWLLVTILNSKLSFVVYMKLVVTDKKLNRY